MGRPVWPPFLFSKNDFTECGSLLRLSKGYLVNNNWPRPPVFFVSVASKEFSNARSPLESTLVRPRGSVDSKASYVRLSRPITGADSTRFSAAELSGDWTKKEKREQAPALHMEFYIWLIIAGNRGKSRQVSSPCQF